MGRSVEEGGVVKRTPEQEARLRELAERTPQREAMPADVEWLDSARKAVQLREVRRRVNAAFDPPETPAA